jgi:hypothetical protein
MTLIIPPALAQAAARSVARWRRANETFEVAGKAFGDAQLAHRKAEDDLREVSRAIALVLATTQRSQGPMPDAPHPAAMPPEQGPAAMPEPDLVDISGDAIRAWMEAGSPTDSEGNMIVPNT